MVKRNLNYGLLVFLILLLVIALTGCGESNNGEYFNPENRNSDGFGGNDIPGHSSYFYLLNITTTNGSVSSGHSGINCGSECSKSYTKNSKVQLTAIPASGYLFSSWSTDCSGTVNPLIVTMDSNKACTANFVKIYSLGITVTNGSVSSNPSGINCGSDCSKNYAESSVIQLTATPTGNYLFSIWSGGCSGTANPLTITMDSNKICTANFVKTHSLSITTTTNGSVSSSPSGINCGSDCSERYAKNSAVQLTAAPDNSYRFSGWSGDCSGPANLLSITIDNDKTCSASFTKVLVLSGTGQTTSYPSTEGEDNDYTITPPSFTNNGDGTVTDDNTGLLWQRDGGSGFYDWSAAVNFCHSLNLGGKDDWRLPSRWELMSIVNYGRSMPSIDSSFHNTKHGLGKLIHYWSSTTYASKNDFAWYVDFADGMVYSIMKSDAFSYARCVQGEEQPSPASFTDNGDGTITDDRTGLIWQQAGDNSFNWEDASDYCAGLELPADQTGWRLPNVRELASIVDIAKSSAPTIDTSKFTKASSSHYWSSTSYTQNNNLAWFVNFHSSFIYTDAKSDNRHVRCVRRSGQ